MSFICILFLLFNGHFSTSNFQLQHMFSELNMSCTLVMKTRYSSALLARFCNLLMLKPSVNRLASRVFNCTYIVGKLCCTPCIVEVQCLNWLYHMYSSPYPVVRTGRQGFYTVFRDSKAMWAWLPTINYLSLQSWPAG